MTVRAPCVFDDRIEIRSFGRLPTGITVEQLSGRHDSKPVNPLIAGAFHRTGAVPAATLAAQAGKFGAEAPTASLPCVPCPPG